MGGLRSWFKRDWAAELDRAEELMASGDPVQALEIATRARRKAQVHAPRAAQVAAAARQGVRDLALENAARSEAGDDLEDAADWLRSAVQHESDDAARGELELRIRQLEARLDGLVVDSGPPAAGAEPVEYESLPEGGLDLAAYYDMLVATVAEPLRPRYADRPDAFMRALVDLGEGRWREALDALAPLAEAAPGDAVLRLETGRARSFLGDLDGALADFEAAWSDLGDQSLDAGDSSSLPALWAETAMEAGRAADAVERLREAADVDGGARIDVCLVYAQALLAAERHGEAVEYLERAAARVGDSRHVKYLLGLALRDAGRPGEAIARLEEVAEAGCRVGCGRDRIHLPSFWTLVGLYSDRGEKLERARELVVIASNTQDGRLGAREHEVLARYFAATGDQRSAENASSEARRLHAIGDGATARSDFTLG